MDCVLNVKDFVFQMMDFVFQMMNFVFCISKDGPTKAVELDAWSPVRGLKSDDFVVENDASLLKNVDFVIK